MNCTRAIVFSLAPAFSFLLAGSSFAGIMVANDPVSINIFGENESNQQSADVFAEIDSDGLFSNSVDQLGDLNAPAAVWVLNSLSITGDADPFIDLEFSITNVSDEAADIIVTVDVPLLDAFPAPNVAFGSLVATVVDDSLDSSVSFGSVGGAPVFDGLIDGATAIDFLIPALTLGIGVQGGSVTVVGPASETDPDAAGALTSIGLVISANISAGDTLEIDSFFSVTPVPEPTSTALVACGLLGIAARRRRA